MAAVRASPAASAGSTLRLTGAGWQGSSRLAGGSSGRGQLVEQAVKATEQLRQSKVALSGDMAQRLLTMACLLHDAFVLCFQRGHGLFLGHQGGAAGGKLLLQQGRMLFRLEPEPAEQQRSPNGQRGQAKAPAGHSTAPARRRASYRQAVVRRLQPSPNVPKVERVP